MSLSDGANDMTLIVAILFELGESERPSIMAEDDTGAIFPKKIDKSVHKQSTLMFAITLLGKMWKQASFKSTMLTLLKIQQTCYQRMWYNRFMTTTHILLQKE